MSKPLEVLSLTATSGTIPTPMHERLQTLYAAPGDSTQYGWTITATQRGWLLAKEGVSFALEGVPLMVEYKKASA